MKYMFKIETKIVVCDMLRQVMCSRERGQKESTIQEF